MTSLLSFLLLAAVLVVANAVPQAHYTTKYDNVNLDEILSNDRLYNKYYDCLKGGKCTPDGKELKDALPEALQNRCAKCNEKQRHGAEKVLKFIIENKHEDYEVLEKIYDPKGTYKKQYEAEAKKLGIKP